MEYRVYLHNRILGYKVYLLQKPINVMEIFPYFSIKIIQLLFLYTFGLEGNSCLSFGLCFPRRKLCATFINDGHMTLRCMEKKA